MGGRKNPFEVMGVTREMAARLNEKALFSLIKASYRTLLKEYHPDRNRQKSLKASAGLAAQAVELNLTFEKLNLDKNAESFRRYHKLYTARMKRGLRKKMDTLEGHIRQIQKTQASLADGFMLYLMRELPWFSGNGTQPGPLLPAPNNVKLGLNDVAINHNIRSASWNLGSNYKEIIFDALGSMFYRPVGRAKPFPVNFIHLLGAVPTRDIDLVPLLDRTPPRQGFFKCPALDSRYGIDGAHIEVLNTMPLRKFKEHCLPLLRPDLGERSYLFSIHRPIFEEQSRISIEGVVVKISRL